MSENAGRWLRDEIENAILSHEFAPGLRLDETLLANRFGVSRTPVREALMQLNAIGLIEIRPRRGAVVIDPGPHRIYQMFEVMAELEGLAGSLAARRLDEQSKEAILDAHKRCEISAGAGDSDSYYYDNEAFHKAIYAASRSEFLEEQCNQLHRRLRPYRRLQLRVRNRLSTSFSEHAAIVEALFRGDVEETRRLLGMHVAVQGERFSDLVANMAAR
ncbi:GntR family transcriptional regulator [Agrobacterium vitis]|uniref:GntR family transcriptional regulator n=1 Tax=Agrobacterium vitis TaxID=373 RepID=A0A368P092_AGRVI|nr:GntR family transcriptional regulator [Agrobacterium vitis]KAA3518783.1 GntR family transcriptional regulator [Agrobacterium vitis]KAA3530380.1 GntR family transcriptional regulator [Agrobacterium vitis]MCF1476669.1 GntR family transcriptional regulator [Agrobacterium vitis]MUZ96135.1 FCD domain-containing protein [Agrobacterium vitis]MVA29244.1 FCD domain-containing protein [Agrobacterium vitis]